MEHIQSRVFIITKQDLHCIARITNYLLFLDVSLAILLQVLFLCLGVHCSVLFSSLSYVSVLKIRSYRKVVKTSTSIHQSLHLFFNLFAYLVYGYCACETDKLFHGTTTVLYFVILLLSVDGLHG